jgi:hypothetical protein
MMQYRWQLLLPLVIVYAIVLSCMVQLLMLKHDPSHQGQDHHHHHEDDNDISLFLQRIQICTNTIHANHSFAFATHVSSSNSKYTQGALKLARRLRLFEQHKVADLLILVNDAASASAFSTEWTHVCIVDSQNNLPMDTEVADGSEVLCTMKILLFRLEMQYEAVMFMDADTMMIDAHKIRLLDVVSQMRVQNAMLAWSPEINNRYMNSGVMILRPDESIFRNIYHLAKRCKDKNPSDPLTHHTRLHKQICQHDQGLLNAYFSNEGAASSFELADTHLVMMMNLGQHRSMVLPATIYNCIIFEYFQWWLLPAEVSKMLGTSPPNQMDGTMIKQHCAIVHFISPKPWDCDNSLQLHPSSVVELCQMWASI